VWGPQGGDLQTFQTAQAVWGPGRVGTSGWGPSNPPNRRIHSICWVFSTFALLLEGWGPVLGIARLLLCVTLAASAPRGLAALQERMYSSARCFVVLLVCSQGAGAPPFVSGGGPLLCALAVVASFIPPQNLLNEAATVTL